MLGAVRCQGPRILLDVLCVSGGGSQLVPASSGYTWISGELHAVHVMLVPSLGVGFLGALCTGTGQEEGMSTGTCCMEPHTHTSFNSARTTTTTNTTTTTEPLVVGAGVSSQSCADPRGRHGW